MTSPQDLEDQVKHPTAFDTIHKKLDKIARLQHVHGKRLADKAEDDLRLPSRLHFIDKMLEQIIGRLDLLDDAQSTHNAKLDTQRERLEEIVSLLRK